MRRFVALVLIVAGVQAEELFQNGDFEQGLAGWRALNMSGQARFTVDRDTKHGGRQSLFLERTGPGRPDWLKQFPKLAAAKGKVEVTFYYRVKRRSQALVTFAFVGEDGEFLRGEKSLARISKKSRKFKKISETLKIPRGAVGCGMNVRLDGDCAFWLDDVEVVFVRKGAKRERRKAGDTGKEERDGLNGDFEKDIRGWERLALSYGAVRAEHDGELRALRLERDGERLRPEEGLGCSIPVEGRPKRATLRLAARTDGARAVATLLVFDDRGALLDSRRTVVQKTGEGFREAEAALDVPDRAATLRIALAIQGKGRVWFDRVRVEVK